MSGQTAEGWSRWSVSVLGFNLPRPSCCSDVIKHTDMTGWCFLFALTPSILFMLRQTREFDQLVEHIITWLLNSCLRTTLQKRRWNRTTRFYSLNLYCTRRATYLSIIINRRLLQLLLSIIKYYQSNILLSLDLIKKILSFQCNNINLIKFVVFVELLKKLNGEENARY